MTMAGSGAARSCTISASPLAAARSTRPAASSRIRSAWRRTAPGVKRGATSFRWREWAGSSLLIIETLISISGRDPRAELYRRVSLSAAITSRQRETPHTPLGSVGGGVVAQPAIGRVGVAGVEIGVEKVED